MEIILIPIALVAIFIYFWSTLGLIFPKLYKKRFGEGKGVRLKVFTHRFLPSMIVSIVIMSFIPDEPAATQKEPLTAQQIQQNAQNKEAAKYAKATKSVEKYFGSKLVNVDSHGWAHGNGHALTITFKAKDSFSPERAVKEQMGEVLYQLFCKNDATLFENVFLKAVTPMTDSYGNTSQDVVYTANFSGSTGKRLNCDAGEAALAFVTIPNLISPQFKHPGFK